MPSASVSSAMRVFAARGSTCHRLAWISRLRRPVSERSTTSSWNTTLLTRRAVSGWRTTSKPPTRAVPPVGRDRGRQDADGRRLARAVRPEQPEHLAGADLEIDSGDGLDASGVDLAELFDFDHGASSSFGPAVTSGAAFSSAL